MGRINLFQSISTLLGAIETILFISLFFIVFVFVPVFDVDELKRIEALDSNYTSLLFSIFPHLFLLGNKFRNKPVPQDTFILLLAIITFILDLIGIGIPIFNNQFTENVIDWIFIGSQGIFAFTAISYAIILGLGNLLTSSSRRK